LLYLAVVAFAFPFILSVVCAVDVSLLIVFMVDAYMCVLMAEKFREFRLR